MSDQAEHVDRSLQCIDCAAWFVFTAGEAAWFGAQQPCFKPPRRCPACRQRRKLERLSEEAHQGRPAV